MRGKSEGRGGGQAINTRGFPFRPPLPTIAATEFLHRTEHNVLEHDASEFRPPIRIVASRQRRRTVAARLRSGVLELLVPSWMPQAERQQWAETIRSRLERRMQLSRPTDDPLDPRALALNARHFLAPLPS